MIKNMAKGSPMKLILGLSIPLLFSFLFQQSDTWQRCFWMHQKRLLFKMCECS